MMQSTTLVYAIILALAIGAALWLGWWLLIESEGVYLGRRVVVWLYDVYARRYDSIKQFDPEWESSGLAQPLLERLVHSTSPRILDVATGTGRLPLALFAEPDFNGQIVAIDASGGMLQIAAEKLHAIPADRLRFSQQNAVKVAFAAATFDAVICLEALEFFPNAEVALSECIRVLKPGGLLLITNRKGTRLMPGRTQPTRAVAASLVDHFGLIEVRAEIWQVDYDKLWARKPP